MQATGFFICNSLTNIDIPCTCRCIPTALTKFYCFAHELVLRQKIVKKWKDDTVEQIPSLGFCLELGRYKLTKGTGMIIFPEPVNTVDTPSYRVRRNAMPLMLYFAHVPGQPDHPGIPSSPTLVVGILIGIMPEVCGCPCPNTELGMGACLYTISNGAEKWTISRKVKCIV